VSAAWRARSSLPEKGGCWRKWGARHETTYDYLYKTWVVVILDGVPAREGCQSSRLVSIGKGFYNGRPQVIGSVSKGDSYLFQRPGFEAECCSPWFIDSNLITRHTQSNIRSRHRGRLLSARSSGAHWRGQCDGPGGRRGRPP
jgi:hypothetical protein